MSFSIRTPVGTVLDSDPAFQPVLLVECLSVGA